MDTEPSGDAIYIWYGQEASDLTNAEWRDELIARFDQQEYIKNWLIANGIESNLVSVDEDIYIDSGKVFYTEHKINAEGHKYVDPATDEVAQHNTWRVVTVPFGK
ncbi:hypothetical protein [Streptomyces sp. SID3212]|uniref:hypothetical protein n=1 Tax=Streptomyces sp. SID3212 TaxID=2690259 RepID=UPI00136B4EA9|nr:hypothetical protein [Streptomyces sp. SID3212]MYV58010.1 hypothetical protein [Streptomyces sp. SID3212]